MVLRRFGRRKIAEQVHEILDIPPDFKGNYPVGTKVINTVIRSIVDALHRGEDVKIAGFGIFRVVQRKARCIGSTVVERKFGGIKSPVPIEIPPKKVVVFEPSVVMGALLNRDTPEIANYRELRAATRKRLHPL